MSKHNIDVPLFGKQITISLPLTLLLNGIIYEVVAVYPNAHRTVQIIHQEYEDLIGPRNRYVDSKSKQVELPVIMCVPQSDSDLSSAIVFPITELLTLALRENWILDESPS